MLPELIGMLLELIGMLPELIYGTVCVCLEGGGGVLCCVYGEA